MEWDSRSDEVLERVGVEVIDADFEDVLWVCLEQEDEALMLAVCYLPPESSSRGQGVEVTLQALSEQVAEIPIKAQ